MQFDLAQSESNFFVSPGKVWEQMVSIGKVWEQMVSIGKALERKLVVTALSYHEAFGHE